MLIPNKLITFTGTNGSGGSRTAPSYVADLLKARWGQRMADLQVLDIPITAPDAYHEVGSIAEEESILRGEFREVFGRVYPDGIRAIVERLLLADASARAEHEKLVNAPKVPHRSFVDLGCSEEQALSLQAAGYATVADLPVDFIKIAEVRGITPDFALKLQAAATKAQTPAKAANPVK